MTTSELEQAHLAGSPLSAPVEEQQATLLSRSNPAFADRRVLYVCNTFGQPDHDRCTALALSGMSVLAVDWSRDDTGYIWEKTTKIFDYKEIEVSSNSTASKISAFIKLFLSTSSFKFETIVVYGFHNPAFFMIAMYFRLAGKTVITMCDSRFSDYTRSLMNDFIKRCTLLPYSACLAAPDQAAEYARYLGFKKVEIYRCAIDTKRIK